MGSDQTRLNNWTSLKKENMTWSGPKSAFLGEFLWVGGGGLLAFPKCLVQIDQIATPTAKIIICPYWQNRNGIRYVQDVRNSSFSHTMLKHRYRILRHIENHNNQSTFPLTFLKDDSQAMPESIYEMHFWCIINFPGCSIVTAVFSGCGMNSDISVREIARG